MSLFSVLEVQKRFENGKRDERLPRENMWDCQTFQAYLKQIGQNWTECIYPGMQKALIGTMFASQDLMNRRLNTFELFGAVFMISEDYQPWLIEINASPDLGATSSVTARLCPPCLEDVIKGTIIINQKYFHNLFAFVFVQLSSIIEMIQNHLLGVLNWFIVR